ncbi:di-heme-cytochrome C peroxidase [Candidatus Albibeggiatoa sp. nov. BB20]|uniref:di-heme-cytochrome C peroxidase n=1 Tax=Candidatus Albibeggiatoa sp. nov. BB20 TaxID=3162723 RepID=UPI0033654D5C
MKSNVFILITLLMALFTAQPALSEPVPDKKTVWLEQNWTDKEQHWYHHTSQGNLTVPTPLEWFVALEQPVLVSLKGEITPKKFNSIYEDIKNESAPFSNANYLANFGFIPSKKSEENNPHGLPVGFAEDAEAWKQAGYPGPYSALGLTCAACHTGQMTYKNTHILYDGGPATINLISFNTVLLLAVVETWLAEERFERFAKVVLKEKYNNKTRKMLHVALTRYIGQLVDEAIQVVVEEIKQGPGSDELVKLLKQAEKEFKKFEKDFKKADWKLNIFDLTIDKDLKGLANLGRKIYQAFRLYVFNNPNFLNSLQEGYARLDALNRIGNTVFASDAKKVDNNKPTDAPVNYPFIWTTSWFNWVQYDGSIMQPMVRNAGEALGTVAHLDFTKDFESTVRVRNLYDMEQLLAGKERPFDKKHFGGLQAPKWPEDILGKIDGKQAKKGETLYKELCQSCHLPPLDSEEIWDAQYWDKAPTTVETDLHLLNLKVYDVGTDPAQSKILATRKVDIDGLGIDTKVYIQKIAEKPANPNIPFKGGECEEVLVKSENTGKKQEVSYAAALGAVVQEVADAKYKEEKIPPAEQAKMNGYTINCLRAFEGYRVRPLNGIWATAPFLHNGSVPNLYDLLSPAAERTVAFYLGYLEFDPLNVGYISYRNNYFSKVDTSQSGSLNIGHEFSHGKGKGIIGRFLEVEERRALIEYLKTL